MSGKDAKGQDAKGKPLSPAEVDGATRASVRIAFWGLLVFLGTRIAAMVLESTSMAALAAQAVVAEYGAGRLGVAWSNPLEPMPTIAAILRRAAQGAIVGAALGGALLVFLAKTGAVEIRGVAASASVVGVGLVTAGLTAMRDELVLHGVTLRALVTLPHPALRVFACGLTSAGAALGEPGSTPKQVVAQGLLGLVMGLLWVRDRGAWQAWGASTAFGFVTQVLARGGVAESAVAANAWGGSDAGFLGGSAAVVALLPAGAASILLALRSVTPAPAAPPPEEKP